MSVDARGCLGTVYRLVSDFLIARGLLEEIKTKLTAPSRKMLEKPPSRSPGRIRRRWRRSSVKGSVGDAGILRLDGAGAEIRLPVRWE